MKENWDLTLTEIMIRNIPLIRKIKGERSGRNKVESDNELLSDMAPKEVPYNRT